MNDQPQKYITTGKYRPLPKGVKAKPLNKRHARRSFKHDYCAPGYYLITSVFNPDIQYIPLSSMPLVTAGQLKSGHMIIPDHSSLGEMIKNEIMAIHVHHPEIRVIRFVIMPDHIHMVIHVWQRLKRHLGKELAGFFGACSKHYSQLTDTDGSATLFDPFHDRILYDGVQIDRAIKYVEDNPRRYILKKRNPHLFKRHLNLRIEDRIYSAYGNLFLLRGISLLPVRVHRKWTEQEFQKYEDSCRVEIEKGAIPISPAIHPAEKKIFKIALEMDSPIIKLRDKGFADRFKPQGKEFELCTEGRLLLLTPWPEDISGKSTAGYTEFHDMNDMALAISKLPAETRMAIIKASSSLSLSYIEE